MPNNFARRSGLSQQPSMEAFFALGFRPFYLLASLYAPVSLCLWVLVWSGKLDMEPMLPGSLWHAHEMLFGFVMAIVAGFLLTAVRVWTGRPTPGGWVLGGIVATWCAARCLMYVGPAELAATANIGFLLMCASGIARPIILARNWRNLFAPVLLLLFALVDSLFFAFGADLAVGLDPAGVPVLAADLLAFLVALVGGRVIPFFTASALPSVKPHRDPLLEKLSLGLLLGIAVLDAAILFSAQVSEILVASLLAAAICHTVRLIMWRPLATKATPLLWILMLSYGWLPIALILRVGADFGLLDPALAYHALFSGLVSGLIIGMITRTARGHTGQPLVAGRTDVIMFILAQVAAIVRVFMPMLFPGLLPELMYGAATLWAGAFLLYAVAYGPWLTRPRPDGKPG